MTHEMKRAMARYEEARVRYRKALLSSLDGASNGDVIRQAIRDIQRASSELKRLAPAAPAPARPVAEPAVAPAEERIATAWSSLRRLLTDFGARIRTTAS